MTHHKCDVHPPDTNFLTSAPTRAIMGSTIVRKERHMRITIPFLRGPSRKVFSAR